MKGLLGVLVIIAGVALGLWLGLYVCFIGGIVDAVEAVKATPVESLGLAVGIAKVFCTGLVGWGSFLLVSMLGMSLLD